eukprot:TRINITY_DN3730_c0_g1_i1.p1 TRINITY_DN3730_c0_g1~~TRINITY_DN3730_c0_g1_i1.p1  ORF type:complete len:247 (-),score=37.40 TRINITY_DN3730_c0_g1_i1:93-833(-)
MKRTWSSTTNNDPPGDKEKNKSPAKAESLEEGPQCGICLDNISIRGIIDICNHTFCFDCIHKWSDVSNTCPMCKARFKYITKKDVNNPNKKPKRNETVTVKRKDAHFEDETDLSLFQDVEYLSIQTILESVMALIPILPHFHLHETDDEDSEPQERSHTTIDLTTSPPEFTTSTTTSSRNTRNSRGERQSPSTSSNNRSRRSRRHSQPSRSSTSQEVQQPQGSSTTGVRVQIFLHNSPRFFYFTEQ